MKTIRKLVFALVILLTGSIGLFAQVSRTNSTAGTVTGVPAGPGGAHLDRTITFTGGDFGGCTSLTEVEISIQLILGNGAPPTPGGYGVHEDLNVRLVSPTGTAIDLVQDRWGYWTGNSSQLASYNSFAAVNGTVHFDDDHPTSIVPVGPGANDWITGNFSPHNPLSGFDGENPVGTWTLRISDGHGQFSTADYIHFIQTTLTITCGAACTDPTVPTVTFTPSTVCDGNNATLNISGTLNDATAWHVYTGSCGGTSIGNTAGSTFVVTPSSPSTQYFVRGEGGCVTPGSCGTVTVPVTANDNASFNYSAASYCVDAPDPTPTITGTPGGGFTSTPVGLSINPTTGLIDVSASVPGAYTVTYTTTGACPANSNVAVTINGLDDPSFSYSAASYCTSDSDPTPTVTGLPGGGFTSTPVGLNINPTTGLIDVSASTPGAYTVTYTTTGTCPSNANVAVTINALDDPSFSYSAASYCVDDTDPTPTITGLGGGGFTSTPVGLNINPITGLIDVSASVPGAYTVTYTTTGACPANSNVAVTINALDDPSFSYSAASYCTSDSDPTPTITGLGGGGFTSIPIGLNINPTTGAIDVSASTPGAYTVTYTTTGACPNSSNVAVTINAADDPSFNYSAASYCVDDSDPTPTITGLGGGGFTSTPVGLNINPTTGLIDVSLSTPGAYTVTYTTIGACPNSSNVAVTINALDDPSFNYSAASYCTSDSDPTPTITGLGGGGFTSTPVGLNINPTTGAVDVSASTPGAYTVTYTTTGACPNSSNVAVTINAADDPSFSYSAASYCVDDSDPTPTITGLGGGGFTSTPVGLNINPTTGLIDVSASVPGAYTVTYTTTGTCPNSSNVAVTINGLDDPSFSYSAASYCVDDSDPTPTITGLGGGGFTSTPVGLNINPTTGAIDVSLSTPGAYTVTYTTTGACPNSSNVAVTINALDDPSFSYSAASYCTSDSDPTPTITGLGGGGFTSTPVGLNLNPTTGLIDVSASTPGVYTVTYTTTGTCPNSSNVAVTINAADDASFSYSAASYCVDDSDPTPTITGLGGGGFTSTPVGLNINPTTGAIDVSASTPGAYTVTYTTTGVCPNSSNVAVTINALDDPSFSYSAASYCTNDTDPTPTITGLGGGGFTSTPIGLNLNPTTGLIDVSASTPGAYTVTYTTTGSCPNSSNVAVTVNTADDASFGYSQSTYCPGSANPTPTITGLAGGGFTSSPVGLVINAATGEIDVAGSTANTYTITYTTTGPCPNSSNVVVTVGDIVAPTAVCQNITVFLDGAGNATIVAADIDNGSSDNCGTVSLSASQTAFTCADLGTNNVTLTVNDGNGNSSNCVAVVTVNDTISPTAVCQNITVFLDGAGNATITGADIDNGSSDNCGSVNLSASQTAFTCADLGANNVTLTVDDGNGNSSTCTATVTVNDSTAPTAVCQNITVFLDGAGNATITAGDIDNGSSDNCGLAGISVTPSSFTCANIGANNVTFTVTDVNSNSSTCTATVTVQDTVSPTAVCQNVTVFLDGTGNATIVAADIDGGSTDNCGTVNLSASQTAFTCADLGANNVTLTVDDGNGNSSTCTATVTVQDTVSPIAVCQNITAYLDGAGNVTIVAADIDGGSTDNCGTVNLSASQTAFTCADIGANTVTLTVDDGNGNTSTCTSTVTIQDTVSPTAVCQDITVFLDGSGNATIVAADIDGGSTDNCGTVNLSASQTAFTCANVGANTVTLTVNDGNGNSSTCTATVTVQDTVSPTAVCQNVTVYLDGAGNATIVAADIDGGSSDVCGAVSLSASQTAFTCADIGANNVTLTVQDGSGNTATCSAVVTVEDTLAPTISCTSGVQNTSDDGTGDCTFTVTSAGQGGSYTIGDNCGGTMTVQEIFTGALTLTQTWTLPAGTWTPANTFPVGVTNVTVIVTDDQGNVDSCSYTTTIIDDEAPIAICQNVTAYLDGAGNATITAGDVDNGSTDNCGIDSLSISQSSFTCADLGPNNVTLTVTDVNGNTSTCAGVVTIVDTLAPTAVCQNVTAYLDGAGNATIVAADIDGGSTDNCGTVNLSASQTAFTCADIGANTVTLTVDDGNGNSSTCTATVTVADTIAPTAICQDVSIQLDSLGNVTLGTIDNGSFDNCGVASATVDVSTFDCSNIGPNTVTLTVTDASGNSSTCTGIVTVVDNIAPVAVCQSYTAQLDASGIAVITPANVDGGSTDVCGIDSMYIDNSTFDCSNIGVNDVTLTVVDVNGNTAQCTAQVTVEDNIAPTAICQNITVALDASGNGTITAAQVDNGSTDACGIDSISIDNGAFTCADLGVNPVTLTVVDLNGNTSTCTSQVTVVDSILPIVTCPADTTVLTDAGSCEATNVVLNAPVATDNCSVATITNDAPLTYTAGVTTVTWTITDAAGNAVTCVQQVTVPDETTTSTIDETACFEYTAPDGMLYTTSGTYTATITNAAGCDSIITINLTINTIATTVTVNFDELSSDEAGAVYQWVDCDDNYSAIAGETNQTFTPTANGNYAVIITENGCTDTSECVTVGNVGLDDITNESVVLYPNPTNDGHFSIRFDGQMKAIELVDVLGRIIMVPTDVETGMVDASELSAGKYMVRVYTDHGILTKEVMITK